MKKSQLIMVWLLPLVIIGGLFYPLLGYLVVGMIAFFLVLSFFAGRYWCWNLCPRGAFLDIAISKISLNRPLPVIFAREWFRWLVFTLLMLLIAYRIMGSGGNLVIIGSVFVGTCILTTLVAIILGRFTRHRAWCAICPMGLAQEKIGKIKKR